MERFFIRIAQYGLYLLILHMKQAVPSLFVLQKEESPDNAGHHTSEMEDTREGIVTKKKTTVPFRRDKGEKVR